MSGFRPAEDTWRERLKMLPNRLRQELVTRQLIEHLPARSVRVLDVGCGQGTQAVRLARLGHQVTGVDNSPSMLADTAEMLAGESGSVRERVRLVEGDAQDLSSVADSGPYDVVLCHGVLMYLPAPGPALEAMIGVLATDGVLSLLVRNADAAALHAGIRGDWNAARSAFGRTSYTNRLGVTARADRIADLLDELEGVKCPVRQWYGVLTFAEVAAMESVVPPDDEFAEILECEDTAGRTDPYRAVSALHHVIASPEHALP